MNYLHEYITQLNLCNTAEDVYGQLLDWQQEHKAAVSGTAGSLNSRLKFNGKKDCFKFREVAMATTAVGSLHGIVLVAANPGWSDNGAELKMRTRSPADNKKFCESFFEMKETVAAKAWWTKAIKFALQVHGAPAVDSLQGDPMAYMQANGERFPLGCIDLVPLHSSRDGFSSRLFNRKLNSAEELLKVTSLASLRLALRLQPKLIVVASSAGAKLVDRYKDCLSLKEIDSVHLSRETDFGGIKLRMFHGPHNTRLMTFPRQVFSGSTFLPKGYTGEKFASAVQKNFELPITV